MSLAILEENWQQHQEVVQKASSLEVEVAKWRATARTLVANGTVAFVKAIRSNRQFYSKVGGVLAKFLWTRLDGDELFRRYKDLQVEKKGLGEKVEKLAVKRDWLAKVVLI